MEEKKPLTIKEKQDILFEMLKDVDAFCRANDIKYCISDGTMLGAVRHGGFIPWDDDSDICMLREDFDKFVATYKSDRFQMLYRTKTDDESFYFGFIKINDPSTYRAPHKHGTTKFGVTMDIFPFESVPEDAKERKKFMHKIRSTENRLFHKQKTDWFSRIKSSRHSLKGWCDKLDSLVHTGKYKDSKFVGQSMCIRNDNVVLPRKLFDNVVDIQFNGYPLRGFGDSHDYLTRMFGDDYMTPKKWAHDEVIFRKDLKDKKD